MITRNVELNRLIAEQNAPDACFTEREKRIMDIALAAQYQYDTSIEGVRQRRARNFDMKTDEHQAVASTTLVSVRVAERRARAALRIAPLCPQCNAKLYVVTAIDAVGFACWDTINCNFKCLATPNLPLAWQNDPSVRQEEAK